MENEAVEKSKLELLRERMRAKHPDADMDDDEAFYGRLGDDYDEYEQELETHRSQAQKLGDMFASDPRAANFLQDWRNGEDPVVALVRRFGEDSIREALDNPEHLDKLGEAQKEYLERLSQNRDLEAQYESNIAASLEALEAMQAREGLSDEDMERGLGLLQGLMSDYLVGKIKPESVSMMLKADGYDQAVSSARHEGTVAGRNAKIEERLRSHKGGDGVAHLSGAPVSLPSGGSERKSIFARAQDAR